MTVATTYYNWQRSRQKPATAPYNTCSPALRSLFGYLDKKYGGENVGCFQNRPVRGGKATSSHAYGAALDWKWAKAVGGPGRVRLRTIIIPWLIRHSGELGIQMIVDYYGSRIWIAGQGWTKRDPDQFGMGQEWATWLHIEVNKGQWGDGRPVSRKIKETA